MNEDTYQLPDSTRTSITLEDGNAADVGLNVATDDKVLIERLRTGRR